MSPASSSAEKRPAPVSPRACGGAARTAGTGVPDTGQDLQQRGVGHPAGRVHRRVGRGHQRPEQRAERNHLRGNIARTAENPDPALSGHPYRRVEQGGLAPVGQPATSTVPPRPAPAASSCSRSASISVARPPKAEGRPRTATRADIHHDQPAMAAGRTGLKAEQLPSADGNVAVTTSVVLCSFPADTVGS